MYILCSACLPPAATTPLARERNGASRIYTVATPLDSCVCIYVCTHTLRETRGMLRAQTCSFSLSLSGFLMCVQSTSSSHRSLGQGYFFLLARVFKEPTPFVPLYLFQNFSFYADAVIAFSFFSASLWSTHASACTAAVVSIIFS